MKKNYSIHVPWARTAGGRAGPRARVLQVGAGEPDPRVCVRLARGTAGSGGAALCSQAPRCRAGSLSEAPRTVDVPGAAAVAAAGAGEGTDGVSGSTFWGARALGTESSCFFQMKAVVAVELEKVV